MEYVSQYQELSEYSSSFAYGMMMMMKIIIIIITRPRPAFGRLGLGGSSRGTDLMVKLLTPHFAPAALSSEGNNNLVTKKQTHSFYY